MTRGSSLQNCAPGKVSWNYVPGGPPELPANFCKLEANWLYPWLGLDWPVMTAWNVFPAAVSIGPAAPLNGAIGSYTTCLASSA